MGKTLSYEERSSQQDDSQSNHSQKSKAQSKSSDSHSSSESTKTSIYETLESQITLLRLYCYQSANLPSLRSLIQKMSERLALAHREAIIWRSQDLQYVSSTNSLDFINSQIKFVETSIYGMESSSSHGQRHY